MVTNIQEAVKTIRDFKDLYKCEAKLLLTDKGYVIIVCQAGLPAEFQGLKVRGSTDSQ